MEKGMKFKKEELIDRLKKLGDWLKDFNETKKNEFINDVLKLEFIGPEEKDVFNAFEEIKPGNAKILILGQDPYPSGKATGFAFLLNKKIDKNDSLYYILEAINKNKPISPKNITNIESEYRNWVKENGVLLLNTSLTLGDGKSKTKHQNAWKSFREQIIRTFLNSDSKLIVYLWGVDAQNLFFQVLNEKKFKEIRCKIIKGNLIPKDRIRKDKKGFKKGKLIEKGTGIEIDNITLFTANHPSKRNGKIFNCSKHFQDEFWKELLKIYCNL